jgi:hypothetical protein
MSLRSCTSPIVLKNAYVKIIVPDGATEVVVSFDYASVKYDKEDLSRNAFGEKFLLDNNFAVVGIVPLYKNWYRTPDIHRFFESKRLRNFLREFERIHTYGTSMGGYGACAFARCLGAHNVVAIAPVSTLAAELVPWEKRFIDRSSRVGCDWTGRYRDAADGLAGVGSVWVIYDPGSPDKPQVERLVEAAGSAVKEIAVQGGGHHVPRFLLELGVIKEVALGCFRCAPQAEVQSIVDMSIAQRRKLRKRSKRVASIRKALMQLVKIPNLISKKLKK